MASKRGKFPRYKPDLELVASLKASANAKCPICLRKRPLVIHHNHATGALVLACCDACNRGIGLLGDMVSPLRRVADLLEHPPIKQCLRDRCSPERKAAA